MTSEYASNNDILDFSWLPQVTKGFSKCCPIYWEANWGMSNRSTNPGLSVRSCLLFSRKPQNNWKTRCLGSHFTLYNLLIKLHLWCFLNISQVITASAQHVLFFAVIRRLSSYWQNPCSTFTTFGNDCNHKPWYSNNYLKKPGHI